MILVLFRGHGEPDKHHKMDEPLCEFCVTPTEDGGEAFYRLAYVEADPPTPSEVARGRARGPEIARRRWSRG